MQWRYQQNSEINEPFHKMALPKSEENYHGRTDNSILSIFSIVELQKIQKNLSKMGGFYPLIPHSNLSI
jgi:hypothetical protein